MLDVHDLATLKMASTFKDCDWMIMGVFVHLDWLTEKPPKCYKVENIQVAYSQMASTFKGFDWTVCVFVLFHWFTLKPFQCHNMKSVQLVQNQFLHLILKKLLLTIFDTY